MAAKVFVLKKPAKCADCGKELSAGTQVRGYPLPSGGWKIYCLKHPKENRKEAGNPPQSDPPQAGNPKPAGDAPADAGWKEVLEALLRIEGKLDRLIALLEGKDENTSPRPPTEGDVE